jgi:hypothetical protein
LTFCGVVVGAYSVFAVVSGARREGEEGASQIIASLPAAPAAPAVAEEAKAGARADDEGCPAVVDCSPTSAAVSSGGGGGGGSCSISVSSAELRTREETAKVSREINVERGLGCVQAV